MASKRKFEGVECFEYVAYVDCWNCGGDGFSHHDCGEDCCCCLDPQDNVRCDICRGKGVLKSAETEES